MKKNKNFKRKKRVISNIFLILIFFIIICMAYHFYSLKSRKNREFASSIEIINNLNNKDINTIETKIEELDNKKQINSKLDKIMNNVNVNSKNNKEVFKEFIFLGDSITEAMKSYGIIPEYRILAYKGENVIAAKKREVPKLNNLKAKKIIVFYGMNDLQNFDRVEDFINKYKELINKVKEKANGAEIIVEKILPIEDIAVKQDSKLKEERVTLFNNSIDKLCKEEGIKTIDGSFILKNKHNLYEPDGVHPKMDFYNYWLEYIKEIVK